MKDETTIERRDVLALALGAIAAMGTSANGTQPAPDAGPAALAATDGELVYVGRDPVRIKIGRAGVKGRFAMITQDVSPGTTIPVHAHDAEDEIIFIQAGQGEATLGSTTVRLAAGSTLFVPQGTWHGGRNTGSETLKWIALYSPSGFEGYFREIGRRSADDPPPARTPDGREALDKRFNIRYRR